MLPNDTLGRFVLQLTNEASYLRRRNLRKEYRNTSRRINFLGGKMKNKNILKTINWTTFTTIVLVGIVTAAITLYDLNTDTTYGEEGQSRAEFRWFFLHTIISVAILSISSFLALGWKRLFPFNVPIAIIIVGFCYALFFLTFTIGWVGLIGIFGFFIAFLIGVILIVSYSIFNFLENRKTQKI